ncbi:MAG: Z1 domain-containing protein [Gammaproteobacteria bacterium]|nr:Z1 domain-containing protein [Gammaproteobacteria bacterium]MBU1601778.1 Z1 domain-containing protein [Gammaproteobacteria bacterium]MBU2432150.1 Z1 domain-containing protein [Gammaproteobacteria bacterium]MBU2450457.1 Z1 domain-containing protein [Gammaproteobacteria bacterium]
MKKPEIQALVSRIRKELPGTGNIEMATRLVCEEMDLLVPGWSAKNRAELAAASEIVAAEFEKIEILHVHSIIRRRTPWYFGPTVGDKHWPAFRDFLKNSKHWGDDEIASLNQASSEVVSLLNNPSSRIFSGRGLVVGHVQSGKTANMTAVMAKALDAGYNTVIILAGLTNKLRYQTQSRMIGDLVQRHPVDWQVLTPTSQDGDFRAPPHGGFLAHSNKAQIAIIKKNVSPLSELRTAIERTLPAVMRQLRILVIDDECDQASVNSARGELDMTAINERIRELLSLLPTACYVGYTATPFANVLINPYRIEGQEIDDLYPRDFITALPKSGNYFGTEKLFGRPPANASSPLPEEEGLDMIRTVEDTEVEQLQPSSRQHRDNFHPELVPSLENALLYYLACCAARRARGQAGQHMTMLIHTSAYVVMHERLAALVESWLNTNRAQFADPQTRLGKKLISVWESEQGRLPADITTARKIEPNEILTRIPEVLAALEVPVENGSSDDRIDYDGPPKTYVVVGGSILARGLTLEGLTVSYFLRTSSQYDTLLQMGRWFGYRGGYEDLPRIWMPDDLRSKFRSLAAIESEIREDIEQYRLRELSPMDIAVRIRTIPGMAITSATKMKHATRCAISYWGTHRQTFRFPHKDKAVLEANWRAAAELVSREETLGNRAKDVGERLLWRNVSRASIVRFFKTYHVDASHADLAPDLFCSFLEQADTRLDSWNVGIVESGQGRLSQLDLGTIDRVKTVTRARLADIEGNADIKALMSTTDIAFDSPFKIDSSLGWQDAKIKRAEHVGDVPLLLLYPIDHRSEPQHPSKTRTALDAEMDVLGFGVVFPGSVTEGGNFVSIELRPLSADELDEIAADEMEQAEAADVA